MSVRYPVNHDVEDSEFPNGSLVRHVKNEKTGEVLGATNSAKHIWVLWDDDMKIHPGYKPYLELVEKRPEPAEEQQPTFPADQFKVGDQ